MPDAVAVYVIVFGEQIVESLGAIVTVGAALTVKVAAFVVALPQTFVATAV